MAMPAGCGYRFRGFSKRRDSIMSETNGNKDFDLTIEEIDQLHTVISFLLENEQYGDDWEDEIELLKKIVAFAEQDKFLC